MSLHMLGPNKWKYGILYIDDNGPMISKPYTMLGGTQIMSFDWPFTLPYRPNNLWGTAVSAMSVPGDAITWSDKRTYNLTPHN